MKNRETICFAAAIAAAGIINFDTIETMAESRSINISNAIDEVIDMWQCQEQAIADMQDEFEYVFED